MSIRFRAPDTGRFITEAEYRELHGEEASDEFDDWEDFSDFDVWDEDEYEGDG
jgi:hypothetical protein